MKNTVKYAWSFSRNFSFLRGLIYYAAPCIVTYVKFPEVDVVYKKSSKSDVF